MRQPSLRQKLHALSHIWILTANICMYIYKYVCVYMCICMYMYVCVYVYVCMYVCMYVYECVGICMCMLIVLIRLCVNLTPAGVITEKGASVGEVPP